MEPHRSPWYIGQHETQRLAPVTELTLYAAHEAQYDMITTPITTANFHSSILTLLGNYNAAISLEATSPESPPPVIPPFKPVDTYLTPNDTISQLILVTSPWIDLASPDPLIAHLSKQILRLEVAYAAFCGATNLLIPGPRRYSSIDGGLQQYARAVKEALSIGSYLQISIWLPMAVDDAKEEPMGSLAPFARDKYISAQKNKASGKPSDMLEAWEAWNTIRTFCNYDHRLSVCLTLPRELPSEQYQSRWYAEPVRILEFPRTSWLSNAKGYPVLSKPHQSFIFRFMRLNKPPWFLLSDVGPIPGLEEPAANGLSPIMDDVMSPSAKLDASQNGTFSSDPTPAEAAHQKSATGKRKDPTPHLTYVRHLQDTQPARSTLERFGAGYQDYLQSPLQPLADNLESIQYEVFEKDPIKYEQYEKATAAALMDWKRLGKIASSPDGSVVVAVVGAGRGPLVARALNASATTGVPVIMCAVEKNPNAYVLLQRRNAEEWDLRVNVVKSDMRAWPGPIMADGSIGKVDILISELLGSFADNELSPECLDGVQHVLNPMHGISIPSSYTAHVTPIQTPRLHSDLLSRTNHDKDAFENPYVVFLHQVDYLSTKRPTATIAINGAASDQTAVPDVQCAWSFHHPAPPSVLTQSIARQAGALDGGAGGFLGGDGANEHNSRFSHLRFRCRDRGVCHGLGAFFECVLYASPGTSTGQTNSQLASAINPVMSGGMEGDGVATNGVSNAAATTACIELSTNPLNMQQKSADMISWFPLFFPLKIPIVVPDNSELTVSLWRQTDDRRVWYEWSVEAFALVGDKRIKIAASDLHSSKERGCLM